MQLRHHRINRRQAYKTGSVFSIGPTTARYLILVLLAVFSLLFLVDSAQGANSLIQINELNSKKTALNQELTTLQVNASRLQSLDTLSQSASAQGLVPVGTNAQTITLPN